MGKKESLLRRFKDTLSGARIDKLQKKRALSSAVSTAGDNILSGLKDSILLVTTQKDIPASIIDGVNNNKHLSKLSDKVSKGVSKGTEKILDKLPRGAMFSDQIRQVKNVADMTPQNRAEKLKQVSNLFSVNDVIQDKAYDIGHDAVNRAANKVDSKLSRQIAKEKLKTRRLRLGLAAGTAGTSVLAGGALSGAAMPRISKSSDTQSKVAFKIVDSAFEKIATYDNCYIEKQADVFDALFKASNHLTDMALVGENAINVGKAIKSYRKPSGISEYYYKKILPKKVRKLVGKNFGLGVLAGTSAYGAARAKSKKHKK